ncbi:MAG TPA: cobalamin biosynthesis protein CbiG [Microcoleaceae bacterium UBA10368]|jgi:Cobalamin biosynthesis protein CbiG|nr:cobalamin biosynthesis protein CbiG [Microcoleaceae cyanobacterium UBA10368]HCV30130.1 cobalamin biosynthesis protein CbiG [Microcoleaceae cyanobacterium UBA9251]
MINEFTLERLDIPGGWIRGEGDWAGVAAAMKRGETVEVIQEVGSTLWKTTLPEGHSLSWNGDNLSTIKARIWISFTQRRFAPESALPKVQWHPRVLWVGIGCEGGTSRELIESAITQVCHAYDLASSAIAGIATIDTKANEAGIVELCQGRNWPLKTFAANILNSVEVPNPSNIVAQKVATKSVAEAAALCAVREEILTADECRLTQISIHLRSSAFICGSNPLLVPKKIFRSGEKPGSVTVAVAVCAIEYLG